MIDFMYDGSEDDLYEELDDMYWREIRLGAGE